ncbi:MAG: hypothetical protein EOM20_19335, partial [Spartobacteria bacterium]|nr:hypothetical protein [Spartobacteria bacterium]
WSRPTYSYNGMIYLQAVPLFLHQYSHGWVDFRDKRDAHADYFLNTALATRAHRDYCLSLNEQFPLYSENLWGVTASKGPEKYMVWGGPPPTMEYPIDGTIVPCSAGGSIAFDPEITIPVMQQVYTRHYRLGWGKYGLIDAFNPHTGWSAASYIGIDVGATMIAIENLRTGNVWKWFMENPEIRRAMIECGFHSTARDLDPADEAYLEGLARDTWAGIQALVHPESGLPWETSEQLPETSLGAVGLYLADIAAASGMELISAEEGAALAAGVITRLQQQAAWNGFFSSRLEVAAGKAVEGAVIATVENGILAAGLITVAAAFPALRESCNALLEAMDWNALYDPESGLLYGGVEPGVGAPVGQWRVDLLGSDGRLAVLMAIASGRAPVQVWDRLNRDLMTSYEVRYLTPGTEGGGMYMQYLPGIFLFEENTFMGRSAANYAYANLEQARLASQDVWGVSACLSPEGGFLGWGALTESIVAPHASALALATYPREVVANLKALEEHGVRAPLPDGDNAHAYGFRDSLDVTSGQVADAYRFADQSMILLSLANFLRDDMIRTLVASCDKVRQAQARIPDYASPEGGPNVSVFMPGIGANVPVPQKIRVMDVPFMVTPPVMDGDFSTWEVVGATGKEHIQFPSHAESGAPPAGFGLKAAFALAWDQDYLYLGINVLEDELVMEQPADELYKDDAVELFVDPACDGFSWGNESDYQIGFSILPDHVGVQSYAWFQKTVPPGVKAAATTGEVDAGAVYTIEAAVPWSFLNMPNPEPGDEFCGTIAVHTVDAVREATAKINWSYVTEVDKGRLGRLRLVGGPPARH